MSSPPLYLIDQALRKYFSSDLSVQDAEDATQFRAQMLRENGDENEDDTESLTINQVLLSVSSAPYATQLAVILHSWLETGTNPLLPTSDESTIEGVTPEFSSRQRILKLSIDVFQSFVAEIESDDEKAALMATISLVDELGGARGILTLLGFQQTIGSRNLAPLTLHQCLEAFMQRHTPDEPLTVGARAFSKHCARSSSGWWGEMKGNDAAKNAHAQSKVKELLASSTWKNIHSLPHAHATMEVRNGLGYGARWDAETQTFRGFLEPPMTNGHEIKWRH